MKIVQELKVTQQEFYDYLIHSLIKDIFKYTNEYKSRKELIHFKYEKKFNENTKGIVEIIDLQEPNIYQTKIYIGSNINMIKYEIIQENGKTKVIYTEEIHSNKKLHELNYQLISFISKKSYKNKMMKKINNIENNIMKGKQ